METILTGMVTQTYRVPLPQCRTPTVTATTSSPQASTKRELFSITTCNSTPKSATDFALPLVMQTSMRLLVPSISTALPRTSLDIHLVSHTCSTIRSAQLMVMAQRCFRLSTLEIRTQNAVRLNSVPTTSRTLRSTIRKDRLHPDQARCKRAMLRLPASTD